MEAINASCGPGGPRHRKQQKRPHERATITKKKTRGAFALAGRLQVLTGVYAARAEVRALTSVRTPSPRPKSRIEPGRGTFTVLAEIELILNMSLKPVVLPTPRLPDITR